MILPHLLLSLSLLAAPAVPDTLRPGLESLWYLRGEESIQAFIAHADQISIVSPQVFVMDSNGVITGAVDPRVIATARTAGVKLIPLVMNPGFDQASMHRVLTNPAIRAPALHALAELCRVNRFDGIQFDFENFAVSDRAAFTSFARAAADSVHRAGCSLSAAVVPRFEDDPGPGSYDQWIYDNWRGGFDYKALADTLDFISFMTYAQHAGGSSPGPVSGYPWMVACLQYLLAQGVPPGKISLGVAGYSDWWYPTYDQKDGARLRGNDISYTRGREILAAARVRPTWDSAQKASWAMWASHGVFQHLWLEDARAFMAKRRLALTRGLRGYSVWLLGSRCGRPCGVRHRRIGSGAFIESKGDEVRYYTCDVFTDTRFGGNQLAVLPEAAGLSDRQMQQIAREFNFSETAFVLPPEKGHSRRVRIFTVDSELPFAGHPNVGTAFVLAATGELGAIDSKITVTFEEIAGLVPIEIQRRGSSFWCELSAPERLSLGPALPADLVAAAVSLAPGEVLTSTHQPQVASVGARFLMVELGSRGALERARPAMPAFEQLAERIGTVGIHLYVRSGDEVDLRVRMFMPIEDAATGSANCALVGLLSHYGAAADGTVAFRIAQGVEMRRPSLLEGRAEKRGGAVVTTWVGGSSVMVSEGTLVGDMSSQE